MAGFIIRNGDVCLRVECDTLFRRVMACVLTGNTDAHLKNFAMMHTGSGLRLAPCYDLLAAVDAAKDAARGIRDRLHRQMEERWKGTFESIGDCLSRSR